MGGAEGGRRPHQLQSRLELLALVDRQRAVRSRVYEDDGQVWIGQSGPDRCTWTVSLSPLVLGVDVVRRGPVLAAVTQEHDLNLLQILGQAERFDIMTDLVGSGSAHAAGTFCKAPEVGLEFANDVLNVLSEG